MRCTRLAPLLLLTAAACAASPPALRQTGALTRGSTITAQVDGGNISLYAPERGQPASSYVVEASGSNAAAQTLVSSAAGKLTVISRAAGVDVLLRGPAGTVANLTAASGSINVADYDGVVHARANRGDIKMLLPQYGTAQAGTGNISVIFASTNWPGTLRFSTGKGDVELYVNETAAARVRLFARHGTVFTDFPLKGTAHGGSEEIDGAINGGAKRAIDVFVRDGSIRLLQLKPQV